MLNSYTESISTSLSRLVFREALTDAIYSHQPATTDGDDVSSLLHQYDSTLRQHTSDLTPLLVDLQTEHSVWILRDFLKSLFHYHSTITSLLPGSVYVLLVSLSDCRFHVGPGLLINRSLTTSLQCFQPLFHLRHPINALSSLNA